MSYITGLIKAKKRKDVDVKIKDLVNKVIELNGEAATIDEQISELQEKLEMVNRERAYVNNCINHLKETREKI